MAPITFKGIPLFDDPSELDADLPQPIDPHDSLADPDWLKRVNTRDNDAERKERDADAALSDFGSAALHRRWHRDED